MTATSWFDRFAEDFTRLLKTRKDFAPHTGVTVSKKLDELIHRDYHVNTGVDHRLRFAAPDGEPLRTGALLVLSEAGPYVEFISKYTVDEELPDLAYELEEEGGNYRTYLTPVVGSLLKSTSALAEVEGPFTGEEFTSGTPHFGVPGGKIWAPNVRVME